jgi:hypothetical protein
MYDSQAAKLNPNAGQVGMLRSPLPPEIKHKALGKIDSSKRTYGSVSEPIPLMTADTRAIGAGAIVKLNTSQKMGLLAWVSPVGTGTAVKIEDPESFNCLAIGGELR